MLRRSLLLWLLSCLALFACKKASPATDAVPLPVVTDATTDLLFTWIDDKGEFHVEQKVADVPVGSRDVVRIADPVKDPPKLDDVYVADLRNVGADGTYPVHTMSRSDFEKIAVERRAKNGRVLTAQSAAPPPPGGEAAKPTVIIYGASWCGPCHQAADYLKAKHVPFVLKDIEADSSAQREMQSKLATAGIRGGSIPVIDVKGKLMVGFDARAVDRALAM